MFGNKKIKKLEKEIALLNQQLIKANEIRPIKLPEQLTIEEYNWLISHLHKVRAKIINAKRHQIANKIEKVILATKEIEQINIAAEKIESQNGIIK